MTTESAGPKCLLCNIDLLQVPIPFSRVGAKHSYICNNVECGMVSLPDYVYEALSAKLSAQVPDRLTGNYFDAVSAKGVAGEVGANVGLSGAGEPQWTSDAPTVEGWYWLRHKEWKPGAAIIEHVLERPGHSYLAILVYDDEGAREFSAVKKMAGYEWCGPITAQATPPQQLSEEWKLLTEELINSQPEWLDKDFWIAKGGDVFIGHYEWQQGHEPHVLISEWGNMHALRGYYVMPLIKPAAPTGKGGES